MAEDASLPLPRPHFAGWRTLPKDGTIRASASRRGAGDLQGPCSRPLRGWGTESQPHHKHGQLRTQHGRPATLPPQKRQLWLENNQTREFLELADGNGGLLVFKKIDCSSRLPVSLSVTVAGAASALGSFSADLRWAGCCVSCDVAAPARPGGCSPPAHSPALTVLGHLALRGTPRPHGGTDTGHSAGRQGACDGVEPCGDGERPPCSPETPQVPRWTRA